MSTAPYGTWPSPVPAAMVAAQGLRLSAPLLDGDDVFWLEGRPADGGRTVLVRRASDGTIGDVTPPTINVRTRVHEYGGGAALVARGMAYVSHFTDQRLYRLPVTGGPAEAVTPPGAWRYADAALDPVRHRLIVVREDHTGSGREPVNTIVAIDLEGAPDAGTVLVEGADFYATPRITPDGARLTWICWRHPQMPWDGSELWVADISPDGALSGVHRVAGGEDESIYQPGWLSDGTLVFASDRDGWWRLYQVAAGGAVEPVLREAPPETEFGRPQWVFGTASWAESGDGRLVVASICRGRAALGIVDRTHGTLAPLAPGLEPADWLIAAGRHAVLVAGWTTRASAVVRVGLEDGIVETLRASSGMTLNPADIAEPEAIAFSTSGGRTAHAFVYAPRNAGWSGPAQELPPLIVMSHGGPTAATRPTFDLAVQYWTTRGFTVVDVNYGGSTGFGRAYRRCLNGQWGLVDVEDCIAAARVLVAQGRVDADRLAIRGGSAGGFTTFAALTTHPDVFAAGAGYYGVSDLEALARETHKFESRYLDTLVGPYPADAALYHARSPIHSVGRLACALILFQGLDDRVVPPNQSQMMADAVREKGLPVALLTFDGEQHGFRRAETIIRCLEAELFFYGAVFGFTPADSIEAVPIANLPVRVRVERQS